MGYRRTQQGWLWGAVNLSHANSHFKNPEEKKCVEAKLKTWRPTSTYPRHKNIETYIETSSGEKVWEPTLVVNEGIRNDVLDSLPVRALSKKRY